MEIDEGGIQTWVKIGFKDKRRNND